MTSLKIALISVLFSILFTTGNSFAQETTNEKKWEDSYYQKISTILSVYLGTNYVPSSNSDDLFAIMVESAIKKFDNKVGQKIDSKDINMLYGPDGKLGLVDYIRMVRGSNAPRPELLEISLRRVLSNSLGNITSKASMYELITKYIATISNQIEDEDIPVILDDGLLEYMVDAIGTAKSPSERSGVLLDVADILYKLKEHKLNAEQLEALAIPRSLFLEQVTSHNRQKAKENLDYGDMRKALCKYLDLPLSRTLTIKELSSTAISKIMLSGSPILSDEELELLVGKGNLYYYLVNEAESTPWGAKDKYEKMSKATLLHTDINTRLAQDKVFPYENIDALKADFMLFNWFYSPMTYWKQLPKVYEQARRNKALAEENKKALKVNKDLSTENIKKSDLRYSLEAFVGRQNLSDQKLLEEAFSLIYANSELNKGSLSQIDIYNLMLAVDFGSIVVSTSKSLSPYLVNLVSALKDVVSFGPGPISYKNMEPINRSLKEFKDIKNSLKR